MKPYESLSTDTNLTKYCFPLRGTDFLDCQKILLGIDPDNPISQLALTLYSLNSYCPDEPLYHLLPHKLGLKTGTFREYGWWWHYLIDQSSIVNYRRPGESHVYIKDVIAYALLSELSTYSDVQYSLGNVGEFVAEAFARKAWASGDGFYKMLGSRESVMMRVDTAIYGYGIGNRPYLVYTNQDFLDALARFRKDILSDQQNYDLPTAYNLAGLVTDRTDWHQGPLPKRPFEWGNPTDVSPSKLKKGLENPTIGWEENQFVYASGDNTNSVGNIKNLFFVVTSAQITHWCGTVSCVTGE